MLNSKSTTIYSEDSPFRSKEAEKDKENKKISYWLEKLHIQREQLKKDTKNNENPTEADPSVQVLENEARVQKNQDLAQSGINENKINTALKKAEDKQIVNDLVKKSNRLIVTISSMFPWDLFPSTIEVEEGRVTFRFRQLFSSQSHSVNIKDISNVFIESTIFFSSLQVVSRTFVQNEIKIGKLHKKKAEKVQKIIEGLRTFTENNINTSNYEIHELIAKIEELHANRTTE